MSERSDTIIPVATLNEIYAGFRDSHNKALSILRSVSAIFSLIASSVNIWVVLKSKKRLTTTHHRIVLGMCVADILYSMAYVHFNFLSPSDLSYMVWNARGNQASCSAFGFLNFLGWISGVLYSCSLNLYTLFVVKYGKTDRYIRAKVEPFLHGVPIVTALVCSVTFLALQNINAVDDGACHGSSYTNIPHCDGIEVGEVREGFNIPCGRGINGGGQAFFAAIFGLLTLGAPIVILTSLGLLYKDMRKQERRMERYGEGALNVEPTQETTADASGVDGENGSTRQSSVNIMDSIRSAASSVRSSAKTAFTRFFKSRSERALSRGFVSRAMAYSVSYFLTWIWVIVRNVLAIARVQPLSILYLMAIFNPLQGPKVIKAKREGDDISWCRAFAKAFRPAQ